VESLPGRELLGAITSNGPSRKCDKPSRKARRQPAETVGSPAADTAMLAERLRGAHSPPASAPALLQRGVPEGGTEMVAVEGAAELPGDGGGPTEEEWAKPALYGHEPPNLFSFHIAKYFYNSLREDGLVTISNAGLIFAKGNAGTVQEIFQDTTLVYYREDKIWVSMAWPVALSFHVSKRPANANGEPYCRAIA